MKKPNIVFILADDLGYGDLSCYGQTTWKTPNTDRLAAQGIRFTDFYSTSPVCSPARTSILTGMHSGHLAIRKLADPFLPDAATTIPRLLARAGYVSACIGKYGVGNGQPHVDAIRKGFDYQYGYNCMKHAHNYFPPFLRENGLKVPLRNRPPDGDIRQWEIGQGVADVKLDYSPDFIESTALRFLERHADRPFFLYYCPTMPHANNEGWSETDPANQTPDGMEVDTYGEYESEDWMPNEKGFARMVQRIDISVGRILDKLEELGLSEDTLVLFSSDNGPHDEGGHSVTRFDSAGGFRGYKRSLHEGGIRIPFIARWKGVIGNSQVSDHQGYFPDLMNTFCELAGVPPHPGSDGISFAPLLLGAGESQTHHDYLYFEFNGQTAVRKGNWKLLRDETGAQLLYDLSVDPHEDIDVKSENPGVYAELIAIAESEHSEHVVYDLPGEPV